MLDHRTDTLRTVRDVVAALGGSGATAALLGIGSTAVSNWGAKDCIPPTHYLDLERLLKERGWKVDSSLFKVHQRVRTNAQ